jgi:hypothetical protein
VEHLNQKFEEMGFSPFPFLFCLLPGRNVDET